MNKHSLPITFPLIYGYLCNAYPLAIALQHKSSEAWFFSNYIQLVCSGNFPEGKFFTFYNSYFEWDRLFLSCPFIQYQKIHHSLIETSGEGFTDFICNAIDNNGYIYVYVDEYYISDKQAYHKYSLPHEMLIIGYNNHKKTAIVLGYNSKRNFGTHEVGFKELILAFQRCDKSNRIREYIYTLEFDHEFHYPFDVKLVIQSLKEYRHSVNSSQHYRALSPPNDWWIYGMSIYEPISQYLKHNIGELQNIIDNRIFHTIWEHKNMMVQRIKYMIHQKHVDHADDILKAYTFILNQSVIVKNLVLKYNLTKNKRALSSIINHFNVIKASEEIALNQFITMLEKGYCS